LKNNFPKGSDTLLETLRTGAPDAFEQLYAEHREGFFFWAGRRFEAGRPHSVRRYLYQLVFRRVAKLALKTTAP
jgi:hypothetical protein